MFDRRASGRLPVSVLHMVHPWTVSTVVVSVLATTVGSVSVRSPVILLPGAVLECRSVLECLCAYRQQSRLCISGLAGSVLEAKLNRTDTPHFYCSKHHDWEVEWLSVKAISRPDCLLDELEVKYDPATNR